MILQAVFSAVLTVTILTAIVLGIGWKWDWKLYHATRAFVADGVNTAVSNVKSIPPSTLVYHETLWWAETVGLKETPSEFVTHVDEAGVPQCESLRVCPPARPVLEVDDANVTGTCPFDAAPKPCVNGTYKHACNGTDKFDAFEATYFSFRRAWYWYVIRTFYAVAVILIFFWQLGNISRIGWWLVIMALFECIYTPLYIASDLLTRTGLWKDGKNHPFMRSTFISAMLYTTADLFLALAKCILTYSSLSSNFLFDAWRSRFGTGAEPLGLTLQELEQLATSRREGGANAGPYEHLLNMLDWAKCQGGGIERGIAERVDGRAHRFAQFVPEEWRTLSVVAKEALDIVNELATYSREAGAVMRVFVSGRGAPDEAAHMVMLRVHCNDGGFHNAFVDAMVPNMMRRQINAAAFVALEWSTVEWRDGAPVRGRVCRANQFCAIPLPMFSTNANAAAVPAAAATASGQLIAATPEMQAMLLAALQVMQQQQQQAQQPQQQQQPAGAAGGASSGTPGRR